MAMGKCGGTLILRVGRTRRARAEPPLSEPAYGRADWCRNFRAQIGSELGLRGGFRSDGRAGTICAECENAFWGAEVHRRQLTPEGDGLPDGEVCPRCGHWRVG